jgi:cell wall-associated NlpC family hydrolase
VTGWADKLALREVLQRRQAWAQPRGTTLKSAKVQDPPAFEESVLPAVREASAKAQPAEPIRLAKASVADPTTNEDLIREALAHRGKPYVWGGASRGGFDCSGLVLYVFRKKRGMMLPHSASAQARMGNPVAREDLLPGDVVFFHGTYRRGISHVGIYIGENKIIHAANHKRNVRIDSLTGYYDRKYWGARRLTKTPVRFTPEELQEIAPDSSERPGTIEP